MIADAASLALHLICVGSSTTLQPSRVVTDSGSATAGVAVTGPYGTTTGVGTGTAQGTTVESTRVTMEGATEFVLENGQAKVRPPANMVARKGKDGWLAVKDLVVTDDSISGRATTSLLASSRFRIDRNLGTLTTDNGYISKCSVVDPTKRAF